MRLDSQMKAFVDDLKAVARLAGKRKAAWSELIRSAFRRLRGTRCRVIRKIKTGQYRLYSRKKDPKTGHRRNLGTFGTRKAAEAHERAVQFYKHQ
jgi:hypothetical protein